uniref:Uncharacterized protein n=1 Tax=Strongyloides stercoralis TaxID=6248 RepID=A0AAF5DIP3_STRER
MIESDLFVNLINEKHLTDDVDAGFKFLIKHRSYFAEELKTISSSNIEQKLLKHSVSSVPITIKKDEVLQSTIQISPSKISQKNLSITLGTPNQKTSKPILNQSDILPLSNHTTPAKIVSTKNFVNNQKITSESKQEFFKANDDAVLKNLLANAEKCNHLESNSIELNFKLKGYLNLLQMAHIKGFENTTVTIYNVLLFSALKNLDSIQTLTQANRALFSSVVGGKHIKTIIIDQKCLYKIVESFRSAIKLSTVSNTKTFEITGTE